MILPQSFFYGNAVNIAPKLLWKLFVFNNNWIRFSWIINEVEAYTWIDDAASHASFGITPRTRLMYETFGYTYIYFIYWSYYCLNFTTNPPWEPWGVLIRWIIPKDWVQQMMINRKRLLLKGLTDGPWKLCQAFWLDKNSNWLSLSFSSWIYVEDIGYKINSNINSWPRIWIKKALDKNWRFWFI